MVSSIENSRNFPRRFQRLSLVLRAISELGVRQITLYGLYRFGLKVGHYKRLTPARPTIVPTESANWPLRTDLIPLPDRQSLIQVIPMAALLAEAGEILAGNVRLFGGKPVPLVVKVDGPLNHWTETQEESQDLKFIWEPARFGWAITLARAYYLTADDAYAQLFWQNTLAFLQSNPANQGPHWSSAQEVALRMIALVFAACVFAPSHHSTSQRMVLLAQFIAEHAERIPPTMIYARAQNNNHLISEAAGLYTAAAFLPTHPRASRWKELGWKWLNNAFQHQITPDGTYTQHSANYHRLILQLALWVDAVQRAAFPNEPFPLATRHRLSSATSWLHKLLDPFSGAVPNLGPNDGAYILPLSTCPFFDYRPVISAAGKAFLHQSLLPPGAWDEMAAWFGLADSPQQESAVSLPTQPPHTLRSSDTWAYLRAAQFSSRPGHADQLHIDLWWRGLNIAQDPGTFRYTAPPPWDNSLAHTAVHNTLMIDGDEQMQRAGRFLYLDRAQASPPVYECASDGSWQRLSASHNGYRRQGITHQRTITIDAKQSWLVSDTVTGPTDQNHQVRLHWLLPDWPYQIRSLDSEPGVSINLSSPHGWLSLVVAWSNPPQITSSQAFQWGLALAGELQDGKGPLFPTWGWTSPVYGDKIPALSLFVTVNAALPITLQSRWAFPYH